MVGFYFSKWYLENEYQFKFVVNSKMLTDVDPVYELIKNIRIDINGLLPDDIVHEKRFKITGKQGVAGTMFVQNKYRCVYKLSQHYNYITEHEHQILSDMNSMRKYCPHFVRGYGIYSVKTDLEYKRKENPFLLESTKPVMNKVIFMEYLDNAFPFYKYIRSESIEPKILYSIIKQTLIAVDIAQNKKGFAHYDLHSDNILIKRCDPRTVFVYVINDKKYIIPTYGFYPVILDYGFSYTQNMTNNHLPIYGPLAHTDVGFMGSLCDKMSDPKLFLITVTDELRRHRDSVKEIKNLRDTVKKIFKPLYIDLKSGWDNRSGVISASDTINAILEEKTHGSRLFKNYSHFCIDNIQSLINLPIQKESYDDIASLYEMMINEFKHIEKKILNVKTNLYIFREMINIVRDVKNNYEEEDTRDKAVLTFKSEMYKVISPIAKFCSLSDIRWEKLLCSIILFSKCVEGICYDVVEKTMSDKEKEYKKMKHQTVSDIYLAIEKYLDTPYPENPKLCIWDTNRERYYNELDDIVEEELSDSDDGF